MTSEADVVIEILDQAQLDEMGVIWTYKIKSDNSIEQTTNIDGPVITLSGTWSTSQINLL